MCRFERSSRLYHVFILNYFTHWRWAFLWRRSAASVPQTVCGECNANADLPVCRFHERCFLRFLRRAKALHSDTVWGDGERFPGKCRSPFRQLKELINLFYSEMNYIPYWIAYIWRFYLFIIGFTLAYSRYLLFKLPIDNSIWLTFFLFHLILFYFLLSFQGKSLVVNTFECDAPLDVAFVALLTASERIGEYFVCVCL